MTFLFEITLTLVLAAVGAAVAWLLKKGADKASSESMAVLMQQFDDILYANVLPALENEAKELLQDKLPKDIENALLSRALQMIENIAPTILSALGFDTEKLESYVRNAVTDMLNQLMIENEEINR